MVLGATEGTSKGVVLLQPPASMSAFDTYFAFYLVASDDRLSLIVFVISKGCANSASSRLTTKVSLITLKKFLKNLCCGESLRMPRTFNSDLFFYSSYGVLTVIEEFF